MFAIGLNFVLPSTFDITPYSTAFFYKDNPYIYSGGWSGARVQDDAAIDFGLQFSFFRRTWSVIAQFSRVGLDKFGVKRKPEVRSFDTGIPCGDEVSIGFSVSPQDMSEATNTHPCSHVHGYVFDKTRYTTLHYEFPVNRLANWSTAGANQYLKSMISIGQTPPEGTRPIYI